MRRNPGSPQPRGGFRHRRSGRPSPPAGPRTAAACLLATILLVAAGCGPTRSVDDGGAEPVVVFAAASLRDALSELAPWLRQEAGVDPTFNFAGSNVLARQIEATPAADVFLSANPGWMDHLEEAGRLVPGSRRTVLANRLVIVARRDSTIEVDEPRDLATAQYRHLSMGDPRAVPAGIYARRFLESVEMAPEEGGTSPGNTSGTLWQRVEDRVAPAADARAALAQVEARRDVVGIVYATDARASGRVEVLFEVPHRDGPAVRYDAAAVAGGPGGESAARRFLDALEREEARQVFRRHGFILPAAQPGGPAADPAATTPESGGG